MMTAVSAVIHAAGTENTTAEPYPFAGRYLALFPETFIHPNGMRGMVNYAACAPCAWQGDHKQTQREAQSDAEAHNDLEHPISPLPPVVCRPWCSEGHGHADAIVEGDQWCSTEGRRIDMSLPEPLNESVYDAAAAEWRPGPDFLLAYAMQHPSEPAQLVVSVHECDGITLTVTETGQLIEALQLLLGEIGQTAAA